MLKTWLNIVIFDSVNTENMKLGTLNKFEINIQEKVLGVQMILYRMTATNSTMIMKRLFLKEKDDF